MADWDGCLNRIVQSVPETEPGKQQLYHYQSFGWLCGGMIEHASGKKFQEILEEAIVHPLEIDGELYIGIPPGVESRLAVLSTDTEDVSKISQSKSRPDLPSSFQPEIIAEIMTTVPSLFNLLQIRQAILPASNGHCSARALARYYAALVDGGVVPLSHSNLSKPPLGSHPHIPEEQNQVVTNENNTNFHEDKVEGSNDLKRDDRLDSSETGDDGKESKSIREMFSNPRIHEAFLGLGEYGNWAMADGAFGLGFRRMRLRDGSFVGFGHTGMGGSTGFCYTKERLAIAVTVNKLSLGGVTRKITELICSELNIPLHEHYTAMTEEDKPDTELITKTILIN
ncbi:hypothetical protein K2173_000426 [Erythroxylum novogranatense]|uniref:Beta-lactamase-related domain-containing protein n=1 Tax=Erythroxylum novogranatense TaxID=1862640 RepID=A0AAV8SX66_9ROSI|nr:hypothetical protein K2173_000426 [Erythroxylum novogranatense]